MGIVQRQEASLIRLAYVIVKDAHIAEDCVQEALIKAIKKCHTFKGKSSLFTWLISILINECKSHNRSRWKRVLKMYDIDRDHIEDHSESFVQRTYMSDCLMKLDNRYRTVLYLFYYEDMDIATISETLSINPSTCRVRLKRGREMLKKVYEGIGGNE